MSSTPIIALLTDFGIDDAYIGVVKGMILSHNPNVQIVDISHGVKSYSILNGQFFLYSSFKYFPSGTIFYVIVDPGVGTKRRALIVRDKGFYFIGPDNGVLDGAVSDEAESFAIHIDPFSNVSATFHGRDIFAPVAALLASGTQPEKIASPVKERVRKPFPPYKVSGKTLEGVVVHVDKFGNVITSFPNSLLPKNVNEIEISNNILSVKQCTTFADLKEDEIGILLGSAGLIELAKNCSSLASQYSIEIGTNVWLHNE